MADVTGQIGNDPIILENAATEATLSAILAAITGSTKEQKANLQSIANAARGKSSKEVEETEKKFNLLGFTLTATGLIAGSFAHSLDEAGKAASKASMVFKELSEHNGSVAKIFASFAQFGGLAGTIGTVFTKLAEFQEEQLKGYQQLTNAGANFSGSLQAMSSAAAGVYMSLPDFAKFVTANSDALAKFGGDVSEGTARFVKISTDLLHSDLGAQLRTLGFTSDQLNDGLLRYIQLTGGRTKEELANSTSLITGTQTYLDTLNGLAEITGKSREAQEQQLQEQSKNAAWQTKLATMDEAGRQKALAGLAQQMAAGGKGAADAFQSRILGLPPMTKEAQQYVTLMQDAGVATNKAADLVMNSNATVADMNVQYAETVGAANKDYSQYSTQMIGAMIMGGSQLASTFQTMGENYINTKNLSKEQIIAIANQKNWNNTQAAQASAVEAQTQAMTSNLYQKFLPAVEDLVSKMDSLLIHVFNVAHSFESLNITSKQMKDGFIAVIAGMTAFKLAKIGLSAWLSNGGGKNAIGNAIGGTGKGIGEALGGIGEGTGTAMKGLGEGFAALGNPKSLLGMASLALIAGDMFLFAEAFKMFTNINWGDVTVGTIVIGALSLGAAALSSIAPEIAIGAAALGVLGFSLELLGKGLSSFPTNMFGGLGNSIGKFVSSIAQAMETPFVNLGNFINKSLGSISKLMSTFATDAKNLLLNAFKPIEDFFTNLGKTIGDFFSGSWNSLKNIANVFKTTFHEIGQMFNEVAPPATIQTPNTTAPNPSSATSTTTQNNNSTTTNQTTVNNQTTTKDNAQQVTQDLQQLSLKSLEKKFDILNQQVADLVKANKDISDFTKRTANILASNGNLFIAR